MGKLRYQLSKKSFRFEISLDEANSLISGRPLGRLLDRPTWFICNSNRGLFTRSLNQNNFVTNQSDFSASDTSVIAMCHFVHTKLIAYIAQLSNSAFAVAAHFICNFFKLSFPNITLWK